MVPIIRIRSVPLSGTFFALLLAAGASAGAPLGAQTISSAASQTFVVADPSTAVSPITITATAGAQITSTNDIRIQIPAGFNAVWDNSITTVTITGSAAGKVSTTVTYPAGNKIVVINVTQNFGGGQQIIVSGLRLASFTAASPPSQLQLITGGAGGPVAATDDKTLSIGVPSLTGAADQTFSVGDPSTAMTSSTVTDDATGPTITATKDIRLRIPGTLAMVWNTSITTATIAGPAAGKVSTTVTYEDAGKTLVLNVVTSFAAGDQITVSGLAFTNFTTPSGPDRLQLVVSSAGGGTAAIGTRTKQIYAALSMSSAANQGFEVNDPATSMSALTITEDGSPTITAANDIRIRIPANVNMEWDTSVLTATLGGSGAGKVSTTVSYEDAGKTLVLNVTSDFAVADQITLSGLRFANFTEPSAGDWLQLVVAGAGGATAVTDDKTKTVLGARMSSAANQVFHVADPATTISPITITDAGNPAVKAASDIRIHVPAGFNMTWDPSVLTATITGPAAAKVDPVPTYLNGDRTLLFNVLADFGGGEQIVISDLRFTSFTAPSGVSNLQLETNNDGLISGTDDKTIEILAVSYGASVTPDTTRTSRLPSNATSYTIAFTVANTGTVTDSYDLLTVKQPGTALTVVSIIGSGVTQGADPDSARLAGLAAGASTSVTVTYSVAGVANGTRDTLILTARSVGSPAAADDARLDVTVIRPIITTDKEVIPSGTQPPGTDLNYRVTITNIGGAEAASVVIVDTLGGASDFKVGSVATTLPAGVAATVDYSSDGGGTWTYLPASGGCGAPAGYDRCVNRIRWRLLNDLSWAAPDNTGRVEFISQIR